MTTHILIFKRTTHTCFRLQNRKKSGAKVRHLQNVLKNHLDLPLCQPIQFINQRVNLLVDDVDTVFDQMPG